MSEYPWREELVEVIAHARSVWGTGSDMDFDAFLAEHVIENWHEEHCDRNDLLIRQRKCHEIHVRQSEHRTPLQRMLDATPPRDWNKTEQRYEGE